MLNISLNGKGHSLPPNTCIKDLLEALGLGNQRIAVECNGAIVPKSLHASHCLAAGDRVEIVSAVGGG